MMESEPGNTCPACGGTLAQELGKGGLCPACLIDLALEAPSLLLELEASEEETLAAPREIFVPGQILGERYRVRDLLGRGGMGQVWRATDLKLKVDVALKALRRHLLKDDSALERLRQEVRVAREVVSPYVCRVFDLVEMDGQELVSMEYIDGITLLDILRMRAPLDLSEAREIAAQFLAGLEAIHEAGLVHRDVKPENMMMTRSGRVVLMDFGIAKGLAEGRSGTIAGTPAYMSPEQAQGLALDARADVFAAGVVLAEMIAPDGLRTPELRQAVLEGVHDRPPRLADTPWAPVLKRALAEAKEQRFSSAAALARALEEVAIRVVGSEEVRPYPGLASFTSSDAEFFFGRELEAEAMWRRLERSHLLGLIGPSGAGKSSFLQAGLLPVLPTGWRAVRMVPGTRPMSAMARELVAELAGDTEALQLLTAPDDATALLAAASTWRGNHTETLVIVDQFEELFTQNPLETQTRFADFLRRLVLEADVRVLLSMRDDFLAFCSQQESLAPIFSELTPLKPLTGGAIRRALVQPALRCGYRFEDDSLVDEMVAEVSDERGALPLLAFAASRLWVHRDREEGLLTREAYEHIGGVAGSLAQHAETTLEKVGQERAPVVRELLRNLVTAQGTRVARDRRELMSVFADEDWETAETVLDALIDARLLTAYELPAVDEEQAARQRVEVIHESLLSSWPRLVRWQTQDADGALLRDQLHQVAELWRERDRPADLLWTGTSFKEFQLWRERYEGGLTTAEEEFGQAMTRRAESRRRRRRLALSAVIAVLLSIVVLVGSLWQRSETSRRQAVEEASRREASQLVSLGRLQLDENPTEAVAYALASLERTDSGEARRFALEALARGPTARVLPEVANWVAFDRAARWLAVGAYTIGLSVWPRDGGPAILEREFADMPVVRFRPGRDVLSLRHRGVVHWISIPDGKEIRAFDLGETPWAAYLQSSSGHRLAGESAARTLERNGFPARGGTWGVSPDERWVGWAEGRAVYAQALDRLGIEPPRMLGVHADEVFAVRFKTEENRIVSIDESGEVRIWSTASGPEQIELERRLRVPAGAGYPKMSTDASRLAVTKGLQSTGSVASVVDLRGPPDAVPQELRYGYRIPTGISLAPDGKWLATANDTEVSFWPLDDPQSYEMGETQVGIAYLGGENLSFTPDGQWLATATADGAVALWPLSPATADERRVLLEQDEVRFLFQAMDPTGHNLVALAPFNPKVLLVPLDGGGVRALPRDGGGRTGVPAFSPDGRRIAAVSERGNRKFIEIWDLDEWTHRMLAFDPEIGECAPGWRRSVRFTSDGRLLSAGAEGLFLWDLEDGSYETVRPCREGHILTLASSGEDRFLVFDLEMGTGLTWYDLRRDEERAIESHGNKVTAIALDPTGEIVVTGSEDGTIRVGPATGEEPHLLFGHSRPVASLSVSPDGQWITSAAEDGATRLWKMPGGQPLHLLPYELFVDRLSTFTNLRVVEDPETDSGFSIEPGPFPGWETRPGW